MPALTRKQPYLLLDGPVGTELISRGLKASSAFWTSRAALEVPELLRAVHLDYLRAGANIVTANTFRVSSYAAAKQGVSSTEARRMAHASLAIATEAMDEIPNEAGAPRFLAASVGPLEDCYRPSLVPPLEMLERTHIETATWCLEGGCDLILAETIGTAREALAIVRAAKKAGASSIAISFIPDESGKRLLGGDPLLDTARLCIENGAETILVNCVHPDVIDRALRTLVTIVESGVIIGAYGNGSHMKLDPQTATPVWESECLTSDAYAQRAVSWYKNFGARILGSCCGTTPAHIKALASSF
jgi:S-methylmethionine-dependent homocysteine/selenocysteine methylase